MPADLDSPIRRTKSRTYLPPEASQEEIVDFAQSVREIERYLETHDSGAALVAPDGTQRPIPSEIFEVLEQVATALANGRGVTIAPYEALLTTQEAADYLGISRPTLVKFLEAGAIPFEKRGRHRRVTLRDLVEYQERSRIDRRRALREIAREGQASGRRPTDAIAGVGDDYRAILRVTSSSKRMTTMPVAPPCRS